MNQNFDPNSNPFQEILDSIQSGQGAPGGASQPGGEAPMDMSAMMGQGGAQPAPQPGAQPGGAAPQGPQPTIGPDGQPSMPENQLTKGGGAGTGKFLVQAIQALNGFIGDSTDPDEILLGRNIIKLLTRLMDQTQTKQLDNLGKGF